MLDILVDAIVQALGQLVAHRDRALLTLFGITWGTAAMVALVSWGNGLRASVVDDMQSVGENLMLVWPQSVRIHERNATELRRLELDLEDIAALDRHVTYAASVLPEIPVFGQPVRYGKRTFSNVIVGTVPGAEVVRKWRVIEGRFLTEADMRAHRRVCLLGGLLEEYLFRGENPLGRRVTVAGVPFTVVGRLAKKNNTMMNFNNRDDEKLLIPATTGQTYFGELAYADQFIVQLQSATAGPDALKSVRRYLAERYHFDPDEETALRHMDLSRIVRLADFSVNAVRIFVGLVGAGTLLIAGLGVMNVMLIGVRERTPEIGLRLALGARPVDIFLQFLTESLVVTAVGGVIGITFALLVCVGVAALDLPPQVPKPDISWGAVAAAAVTMVGVGLTAGTWPAVQASRLDPVAALRYE